MIIGVRLLLAGAQDGVPTTSFRDGGLSAGAREAALASNLQLMGHQQQQQPGSGAQPPPPGAASEGGGGRAASFKRRCGGSAALGGRSCPGPRSPAPGWAKGERGRRRTRACAGLLRAVCLLRASRSTSLGGPERVGSASGQLRGVASDNYGAAAGGMRFADRDEHVYFWFPLLAGLSELTFDPRCD